MKRWRPSGFLTFKVLGDNLFLIKFKYEEDKIRVLKGRLWICEDNLFFVEDFGGLSWPMKIEFERAVSG